MLFDALDAQITYPAPLDAEQIAKELAQRWLSQESTAMRSLFERELATVIRQAASHPALSPAKAA